MKKSKKSKKKNFAYNSLPDFRTFLVHIINLREEEMILRTLNGDLVNLDKTLSNCDVLYPWKLEGICEFLNAQVSQRKSYPTEHKIVRYFQAIAPYWDEFSGSIAFPIPGIIEDVENSCYDLEDPEILAQETFYAHDYKGRWYEGEYAARRRRLIKFAIGKTAELLEINKQLQHKSNQITGV